MINWISSIFQKRLLCETEATNWENILASHIFNKGLISRIYKEVSKLKLENSWVWLHIPEREREREQTTQPSWAPSYSGSRNREDPTLMPDPAKTSRDPISTSKKLDVEAHACHSSYAG
jgi:hypothetical protein